MSGRARNDGKPAVAPPRDPSAPADQPLYSLIRELDPKATRNRREDVHFEEQESSSARPAESGFFAQAARISMGTAFPALRSVARFLSLESYRSLPKHDRLPDLGDVDEADVDEVDVDEVDVDEVDVDDLLGDPRGAALSPAEQLLDWDELEVEEITPTPYQRYLFELRIKGYLRQTREQLSPLLLIQP